MPLHVSSTCAHHQEVKIALHSLWYRHTETSEWSKITKMQFYKYEQIVVKFMIRGLIYGELCLYIPDKSFVAGGKLDLKEIKCWPALEPDILDTER